MLYAPKERGDGLIDFALMLVAVSVAIYAALLGITFLV